MFPAGTYVKEVARRVIRSVSGEEIQAGEAYFYNEEHKAALTLSEGEEFLLGLRQVSTDERKKLAKSGAALPDGSYPIANCSDASNAIRAIGRAPKGKQGEVRSHIRKRVKALGCSGSIFDNWK